MQCLLLHCAIGMYRFISLTQLQHQEYNLLSKAAAFPAVIFYSSTFNPHQRIHSMSIPKLNRGNARNPKMTKTNWPQSADELQNPNSD